MMYPVLAKVRYDRIGSLTSDRRMLWRSLVLNWLVGPALMFALAWTFLADEPEFRTGVIVVGLARCIAMVLIWNDLSCGDREAGALLVAVNSVFQIAAYALLGTFSLKTLPGWLGLGSQDVAFSTWGITKAVLVFLGIPLVAGLSDPADRRTPPRRRVVREPLPAADRAGGALRSAVHDRRALRAAGRCHHQRPAHGRPHRRTSGRLFRADVVGVVLGVPASRPVLRVHRDGRVHRHGQQFRVGHRRVRRRLSFPAARRRIP